MQFPPEAAGLPVRDQALDVALVGLVDERGAAELALPLGRHVGVDVAQVAVAPLHLAGGGELEALLGRAIGLDLRHEFLSSRRGGASGSPASSTSAGLPCAPAAPPARRRTPSAQCGRAWRAPAPGA